MGLAYPATVADWRRIARKRLPHFYFDYIDGGAGEERTLAANAQAFADLRLRQRVMVNVEGASTQASIAPTAAPGLAPRVSASFKTASAAAVWQAISNSLTAYICGKASSREISAITIR